MIQPACCCSAPTLVFCRAPCVAVRPSKRAARQCGSGTAGSQAGGHAAHTRRQQGKLLLLLWSACVCGILSYCYLLQHDITPWFGNSTAQHGAVGSICTTLFHDIRSVVGKSVFLFSTFEFLDADSTAATTTLFSTICIFSCFLLVRLCLKRRTNFLVLDHSLVVDRQYRWHRK